MTITFDKVNYTYQAGTPFAARALFDIDLRVADGAFTAVIGHTGSGKSTLMQHLNALLTPTAGTVTYDFGNGEDAITATSESKQKGMKPIRRRVGLVFQFPEAQLFEETVLKDVAFGPQNFGVSEDEATATAREKLGLVGIPEEFFERSPFELSGGQMRRVAIAGILAMNPDVLVLDEPTAGLDPKARIAMMALFERLHQAGETIVLVTHLMDDVADFADYAYLVEHGHLIRAGKPQDIFQEVDFLKAHGLGVPKATEFALQLQQRGMAFDQFPITRRALVASLTAATGTPSRESVANATDQPVRDNSVASSTEQPLPESVASSTDSLSRDSAATANSPRDNQPTPVAPANSFPNPQPAPTASSQEGGDA